MPCFCAIPARRCAFGELGVVFALPKDVIFWPSLASTGAIHGVRSSCVLVHELLRRDVLVGMHHERSLFNFAVSPY